MIPFRFPIPTQLAEKRKNASFQCIQLGKNNKYRGFELNSASFSDKHKESGVPIAILRITRLVN